MEDWKKEEVRLLRGDIYDRLLEIGEEPNRARVLSGGYLQYDGPLGTPEDKLYINQRFGRIMILYGLVGNS